LRAHGSYFFQQVSVVYKYQLYLRIVQYKLQVGNVHRWIHRHQHRTYFLHGQV
jgi:hypothetical protein